MKRGNIVHFGVRKVALRDKGQTQLLAVLLDEAMVAIRTLWLLPLPVVEQIGSERKKGFVIRPSCSAQSRDKFRPYCFQTTEELVQQLRKEFERFDSGSLHRISPVP
jgi:hypothetical protein